MKVMISTLYIYNNNIYMYRGLISSNTYQRIFLIEIQRPVVKDSNARKGGGLVFKHYQEEFRITFF